jgi:hypothetical protein
MATRQLAIRRIDPVLPISSPIANGTGGVPLATVAVIQFLTRFIANAANVHLLQLSDQSLTERSGHYTTLSNYTTLRTRTTTTLLTTTNAILQYH